MLAAPPRREGRGPSVAARERGKKDGRFPIIKASCGEGWRVGRVVAPGGKEGAAAVGSLKGRLELGFGWKMGVYIFVHVPRPAQAQHEAYAGRTRENRAVGQP